MKKIKKEWLRGENAILNLIINMIIQNENKGESFIINSIQKNYIITVLMICIYIASYKYKYITHLSLFYKKIMLYCVMVKKDENRKC